MSGTPGLGAFNKDKVANKFGIQLKPKDASQRPSTPLIERKTSAASSVFKNQTISDFRVDNKTNGTLEKKTLSNPAKTPEPTKKSTTSKSASQLVNTSAGNAKGNSSTSNVNHSTTKSKESLTPKSPSTPSTTTAKRPSIISTERAVSPAPPVKRPAVAPSTTKTEAQIERQKDQPLYKRQLSKPLDNTSAPSSSSSATTIIASAAASTTSLKR